MSEISTSDIVATIDSNTLRQEGDRLVTDTFFYAEHVEAGCDHDVEDPRVHVCEHQRPTGRICYVVNGKPATYKEYKEAVDGKAG